MKHTLASLAALTGAAFVAPLFADGTRLPDQDTWAMARGNSVVAGINDPAAVYYNPAGLAAISTVAVSGGVEVIEPKTEFTSAVTGRTVREQSSRFNQPNFFAAVPLGGGVTLGAGGFSPFGLSTSWPGDSGFAGLATYNDVRLVTGELAAAWKPMETLSVGAGLQINHLRANLNRIVPIGVTPTGSVVTSNFGFRGTGEAESGNVGVQWQVAPEHTLGLHYQRQINFQVDGTAQLGQVMSQPGRVGWVFPEDISAGWQWAFAPGWQSEVSVDWTNWNRVNTLNLHAGPLSTSVPLNWKSSSYYALGVSNRLDAHWSWAAGYVYSESSVPEAALMPTLPDVNRQVLSAGVFWETKGWKLEAAVQRGLRSSATRTDPEPDGLGGSGVGTYHNSLWSASFGAVLRF